MKRVLFIAAAAFAFASCNDTKNTATSDHANHQKEQTATEAPKQEEAKPVTPAFTNLEAGVSEHVKALFDHYIHVKTALFNSNAAEAKNGATAILNVLKTFDRSLLPAQQKEAYDKSITGIRTAAEGIAATTDLAKQREHFGQLSQQAYAFAKSFGAGRTLYHDHCPMAFDGKGALWLSEQKEIKNPYYGSEMADCGTVEEVIEK